MTSQTVPAFITKLWNLVEDPRTNEFISWDQTGKNFCVFDQLRFSKEVLPLYFKHNNISSFIRQLNLYGFRKLLSVDQGALKSENDTMVFHHVHFRQDNEALLDKIKRKSALQGVAKVDGNVAINAQLNKLVNQINELKEKQEDVEEKLISVTSENASLWREYAVLSGKHSKQQQIINKLVQFLVSLVGSNREINTGVKRKVPQLMITDVPDSSNTTWSGTKIVRLDPTINTSNNNIVIQDVTRSNPSASTANMLTQKLENPGTIPVSINTSSSVAPAVVASTQLSAVPVTVTPTLFIPPTTSAQSSMITTSVVSNPTQSHTNAVLPQVPLQINEHNVKDSVQKLSLNIDEVKEMLTGQPYNLDCGTLSGLFTPDAPMPSTPEHLFSQVAFPNLQSISDMPNFEESNYILDNTNNGASNITGNELVQYSSDIGPIFEESENESDIVGDIKSAEASTTKDLPSELNTPILTLRDIDDDILNLVMNDNITEKKPIADL